MKRTANTIKAIVKIDVWLYRSFFVNKKMHLILSVLLMNKQTNDSNK